MAVGNLAAIAQSNLKRMLAYSGIAQLGFMLLGFIPSVVAGNTVSAGNGYGSSLFYVLTYVLTTLGTFGLIMVLSRPGFESEEISDLAGLHKRSPMLAGVMAVFMFSLAGIPPTVGFYAKLAVLQALITTNDPVLLTVSIVAVLLSLVAAFYYLRVIKVMYFDEPAAQAPAIQGGAAPALLSINALAVLALGILPGALMTLCANVITQSLAG
jgi:NADH-quinone oxidoreductase subunit N